MSLYEAQKAPINEILNLEAPYFMLSLWFLMSLFIVRVLYWTARRIAHPIFIAGVSVIMAFVLYYGLVLTVYKVFFMKSYIDARINAIFDVSTSLEYFWILLCLLANVIVINNLFKMFAPNRVKLLTFIGENSMVIYVTHYLTLSIAIWKLEYLRDTMNLWLYFGMMSTIMIISLVLYYWIFTKTSLKKIF